MNNCTFYNLKAAFLFKIILSCLGFLCFLSSCDFFEDELKQDRQLAYYRYQVRTIPDSINTHQGRVQGYKSIVKEVDQDEELITPRKKNKLLAEVYNAIGTEYYETNDMENAIASATLAIALDAGNQYAYYSRGCMYQRIGEDSLAIADYGLAILNDEKYADSYYNRGILYEKNTEFQLAIEDYSSAIQLKPTYLVDAYNNRGNVYQKMDFFDKALDDYDKALDLDPTLIIVHCNRADTYLHLGEYDKALEDYKEAARADSTNAFVLSRINEVKRKIKEKVSTDSKNITLSPSGK